MDTLRVPNTQRTRRARSVAVPAIVVMSAVGGALSSGHPTALGVSDRVFSALFAAAIASFASRAEPWTWAVASGVAVAASAQSVGLFLGAAVVFGAAVACSGYDVQHRVVGASLGAATVQILLRLPTWGPFGLSALLTIVATAPLTISGFARMDRATRRRIMWVSIASVGGGLMVTALLAVTALTVRPDLNAGVLATKRGVDAARRGIRRGSRLASLTVHTRCPRRHLNHLDRHGQ